MSEYHESDDTLPEVAKDLHRALSSLKEEIEAIDWYNQRAAVTKDDELRYVLLHNRNEEIEHACMALEWLRRNMPPWHEHLKRYLFQDAPISELDPGEGHAEPAPAAPEPAARKDKGRGLGSLKGK